MGDRRAEADELIAYHAEISGAMTAERTALESRLIPVSAYILVSAAEAWYRWPDIMTSIDKVMRAEDIGAAGRRPGMRVNDWGTSLTEPEDYLDHLAAFGLYSTDGPDRALRPVDPSQWDGLVAAVRKAQADHYRHVAAMSRRQKIDAGAYVYFSFLRPFAEVAGAAADLDWTVPRDTVGSLYEALEPFTGEGASIEGDVPYYQALA